MLADHPTWPKKLKKDMNEEEVVFPTLAQQQGLGQSIPTTPPFPPQPTNQGTQAQQAAQQTGAAQAQQALVGKPCPFCGGPMACQYVTPSSLFGNVAAQPAQLEIGCYDTRCLGPRVRCLSGNMATAIQLWNTRSP